MIKNIILFILLIVLGNPVFAGFSETKTLFTSQATSTPSFVDPTSISDLFAWYDSSDTSTITSASNLVSQINDKSTNAFNLTQSTDSKKPHSGTRSINSLNVLDCDGGDNLVAPSGLYALSLGSNTQFYVFQNDVTTSGNHFLMANDGGFFQMNIGTLGTTVSFSSNSSYAFASKTIIADTDTHLLLGTRNGTAVNVYYDGVVGVGHSFGSNTTLTQMNFCSDQYGSQGHNGALAEVIYYNRALSSTEINQVKSYLATKWAFSASDL